MTPTGLTAPYALARFRDGDTVALGVVAGDRIRRVSADELGASGLNDFLAAPDWDRIAAIAKVEDGWMPLADVTLTAPVEPRQVLQTGANYRTHVIDLVVAGRQKTDPRPVEELREWAGKMMDDRQANGEPYFFIGLPAAVVGDDLPLVLPSYSDQHDWELELAVVIGREAFRVSRARGDGPRRRLHDRERHHDARPRVPPGHEGDRHRLVPRQERARLPSDRPVPRPRAVRGPGDLDVRLELGDQVMQDASTNDLLFDIPALVSAASQNMPLLPGDLLLTGSPAGNGAHWGRLLRDGDVMTGTIEGLGTQVVRCVADS